MQEDAILVKQTLEGDEQAFHRLIMKYYAKIYALILSWMKNPEDAKDLTQEVFLEAYLDLGSLKHHEQFRIWLRQIARHQCQDWLRKEKTYIQLDEDMVCETPSADETLILRETLAKVMKAIDELPESESQLLKDRYLDDASYDDLETKHGLSQGAIAMRLLRARQHVRDKVKALSGLWILPWHDMAKKIFVGGMEAMKITAKVKFIAGVTAILILSGTGVVVWHYQQLSQEATSDSSINQTNQKASLSSDNKQLSANNKTISGDNASKLAENQNLDARDGKASGQMIASGTSLSGADNSNIDPKLAKKIEVYSGLMRLLPEYKQAKQSAESISEEMRSQTNSDFLYDRNRFPEIYERRYGPDGIKVFDKQGKEITDNPEINAFVQSIYKKQEEIRTLAIKIKSTLQEIDDLCPREVFEGWTNETSPRRITGVVSWSPTGDYGSIDEYRLAKWLGKELPWDGNADYKNAKDFTQ